jgi:hypothetical protein
MKMLLFLALLCTGALTVSPVESLLNSCPEANRNRNNDHPRNIPTALLCSRRKIFQQTAVAATAALASVVSPNRANAACLQGDLRAICIGIYKIPDEEVYPFFSTPEEFQTLWPDLTYVPRIEKPKSLESAMALLEAQRAIAVGEITQQVFRGDLEEAGISVLGLIPLIANGCNRVLQDLAETKIRVSGGMVKGGDSDSLPPIFQNLENQVIDVNWYWNDCDLIIGQGLRGELGASAVTQIRVLTSLKDAIQALEEFLATAKTLQSNRLNRTTKYTTNS